MSEGDKKGGLEVTPELSINTYRPEGLDEYQEKVSRKLFQSEGSDATDISRR